MGELKFSDLNGGEASKDVKKKPGITISPVAALILLLLAVCLSVLVGLIVHFASPWKLTFTCTQPAVGTQAPADPSELKGRCLTLITGGDATVCVACPKPTVQPTEKPTSIKPTTQMITATMPTNTTKITTTILTTTLRTTTPAPVINYRLPTSVKPWHYYLEIQPEIYGQNASLFTFNGSVSIILNVTQATSNITLHKKDLTINDHVELKVIEDMSVMPPNITKTTYIEKTQFYVIHLDGDLDPLYSYELSMTFESKMRTDGVGLYLSSYKDNNETVYLATTQFQISDARKAFPCFDEPAQKATFDITLVRKDGTGRKYKTFGNTYAMRNETRGEYTADIYETTPKMSTYLLAFVVCDFEYYDNRTSNIDYRTIVRPNILQYVARAHQYGLDLFDWFEATLKPSYPLPKLDNIAVPDFNYGGMENWGLIIYPDRIMYVPGQSTAQHDEATMGIIAHEIAHQWFGNIVSPKWWSWAWLSEGFATFLSIRSFEAVYPARRALDLFVAQGARSVLFSDGIRTSRPLTIEVESHDELFGAFGSIAYTKGAAIIRMMEFIMGKSNFVQGLNLYLTRHQYSVAEHQDLWDALTESTQNGTFINMTDIMDPWVTQMNYPLVTVRVVGPGQIHVRQERFLNNMSLNTTGDTAKYDYRWTIPIAVVSSSDTSNFQKEYTFSELAWLDKSQTEATLNDSIVPNPQDPDSWVVVNFQQPGFYRVNYEDTNWMALIRQLERDHEVFPPVTRAQIIDDAWSLYEAGLVNMTIALRSLNFLKNETDYVPWIASSEHIDFLEEVLARSELYGAFKEFMKDSTQKTYATWGLNITEETLNINIYQMSLGATYACTYGVQACIDDVLKLYRNMMIDETNNRLDPNIQQIVTRNAIRYGGIKEWDFSFSVCRNIQSVWLQYTCLIGLSETREPWLLEKMLNLVFDPSVVPSSTVTLVINSINKNTYGRELAWNFVKTNFKKLEKYIGTVSMSQLIISMSGSFSTKFFLSELQDFAALNMTAMYATPIQRAMVLTQERMDSYERHSDIIKDWLVERGYGDYIY